MRAPGTQSRALVTCPRPTAVSFVGIYCGPGLALLLIQYVASLRGSCPGSAIPAPPQSSVGPWVCAADGPEGNGPLLGLGLLPGLERLSGPSSHRQPEGDSVSATLLPPAPGTPGHTAATGQTGTWRSLGLCGSLSVSPLSSVAFPLPSEPSGRGQCWRGTEEKSRA